RGLVCIHDRAVEERLWNGIDDVLGWCDRRRGNNRPICGSAQLFSCGLSPDAGGSFLVVIPAKAECGDLIFLFPSSTEEGRAMARDGSPEPLPGWCDWSVGKAVDIRYCR